MIASRMSAKETVDTMFPQWKEGNESKKKQVVIACIALLPWIFCKSSNLGTFFKENEELATNIIKETYMSSAPLVFNMIKEYNLMQELGFIHN